MAESKIGDVLYWRQRTAGFPFGHAGIVWFGDGDQWSIEAVGGTLAQRKLNSLNPGPGIVYRCSDAFFAAEAASVAHIWSLRKRNSNDSRQGGLTGGKEFKPKPGLYNAEAPQYGLAAAIASAFVIPRYGRNARKRAQGYRDDSRNIEGPSSFFNHGLVKSKLFCSMFVVAALQAATAGEGETLKYCHLDARHTTPLELARYLGKNTQWTSSAWD